MGNNKIVSDLLRISTEMVRESAALSRRVRECIHNSDQVMHSSRKLLMQWPVSGTPLFSPMVGSEPQPEVHEAQPLVGPTAPASQQVTGLERIEEQTFVHQTVRLDGRHFVDCVIEDCILEYWGGPVILEGTHFSGCRFSFGGEAAMTVSMLECFGLIGQNGLEQTAVPPSVKPRTRVN